MADPRWSVTLGGLSAPLREQLVGVIRSATARRHLQADADAIVRLAARGILTQRERDRARARLVARIERLHTSECADG